MTTVAGCSVFRLAWIVCTCTSSYAWLQPRSTALYNLERPQLMAAHYDLTAAFAPRPLATTLGDLARDVASEGLESDRYGSSAPWLDEWQSEVAGELGKDSGLFVLSGVMAQSIALCLHHDQRRGSDAKDRTFICHPTSHLLIHEEDGWKKLLHFEALEAGSYRRPLSHRDVADALQKVEASGQPVPSCVIIELPHREIGGQCTPWGELVALRDLLRSKGIAFHADGARLWESQAYYGRPLAEICSLFDTVYVSFYKGLGAISGAMLLGPSRFINEAKQWNRRFGGNLFSIAPYALDCRRQYKALGTPSWTDDSTSSSSSSSSSFHKRAERLRHVTSLLQSRFPEAFRGAVPMLRFEPSEPHVCMVHMWIRGAADILVECRDAALVQTGVKVFRVIRGTDEAQGCAYFEWTFGPNNMAFADEVFVEGWAAFLNKLAASKSGADDTAT